MKKLFKNILVAGLTLTTIAGFANAPITGSESNTVITFNDVKPGQKLFIKNNAGTIIHEEIITETGSYSKGFELSNLPKGKYTIELEKDFEIKVIPFKVDANTVTMIESNSYVYFKPVVRSKDNLLFISKLTFDESPMNVKVYYDAKSGTSNYDLIYSETLTNNQILERIYRLKENEKGTYKVVMSSNNRTFSQILKI
ncbi:hypothetical protein SAMN03097699_2748 [Flavobacteriaceae bacterium MAR_2010_188]|nr:hypothetical protein SAMN03097699_2748 [Flavobacteriaceae bacterium MAR_2010_188]